MSKSTTNLYSINILPQEYENIDNSNNESYPFSILQKKRLEDKDSSSTSNKLSFHVSSTETLNNSASTAHKTLNMTNLTNNNNQLNTSNSNVINKFSPIPKPDFSFLEKKENSLSYKNKGSYKKPKYAVPDSPIKTPNKYSNTSGNGLKLGKKQIKKAACRKLNFSPTLDQDSYSNANYNYTNSNCFSNGVNFDTIKASNFGEASAFNHNTSKLLSECSEFKNPFINFNNLQHNNYNNHDMIRVENYGNSQAMKEFSEQKLITMPSTDTKDELNYNNWKPFMPYNENLKNRNKLKNKIKKFNNEKIKTNENESEIAIKSNLFNHNAKYYKHVCFADILPSEYQPNEANNALNDIEMRDVERVFNANSLGITPVKNHDEKFNSALISSPVKTSNKTNSYLDKTQIKSEFFHSSTTHKNKCHGYGECKANNDEDDSDLIAQDTNENTHKKAQRHKHHNIEVSEFNINSDDMLIESPPLLTKLSSGILEADEKIFYNYNLKNNYQDQIFGDPYNTTYAQINNTENKNNNTNKNNNNQNHKIYSQLFNDDNKKYNFNDFFKNNINSIKNINNFYNNCNNSQDYRFNSNKFNNCNTNKPSTQDFINNCNITEFQIHSAHDREQPAQEININNFFDFRKNTFDNSEYNENSNLSNSSYFGTNLNNQFNHINHRYLSYYSNNTFNYQQIMDELSYKGSRFESEFRVLRLLDSGAFGVVYKCRSKLDNQIYAVKKTKKSVGKGEIMSITNLISDLNLFSKFNCLSHFVTKYIDSWLEEGILYIKQEFCENGDLLDLLQKLENKNFVFNADFYWDIIFDMICGLKYLHDSGYLHMDIKPQNFLVNKEGIVKLGDFNLSKKKNFTQVLQDDYFEGDAVYLAPEMLEAKTFFQLSEKCDVFSLGLTILEILGKIELPQNGLLWQKIRSKDFIISKEFFQNSNLKEIPSSFFRLIQDMITVDLASRRDLQYILENYTELRIRFESLKKNEYNKSYLNFIKSGLVKDENNSNNNNEEEADFPIKRTDSSLSHKISFNM